MKIVLSTIPKEGEAIQWYSPKYFMPDKGKYFPLGILSLASNIPKGYDIKILDPHSRNWSIDKTVEKIENENADIVGLSVVTSKAYPMTQLLNQISAPYKVVGGPHATHNAKYILNQGADAVFVGPLAEHEFAKAIKTQPKGIIDCKTDINEIQFPDRKLVDYTYYYSKGNLFKSNNRLPMFSGIGCPNHCKFCDVQTKKVMRKTPKSILDEMIYLDSIGVQSIHVLEDNFNTNEDFLQEICKEMDKRDFYPEWSGRGQAKMSFETSKMIADRGFKRIHVGLESLSDTTLRFFRKRQNYKQIQKFCKTMNDVGIDIFGFFIIGAPTETKEDRRTMTSKIKQLGVKYPMFSILQPLSHTEYYHDLLEQRVYKKDFWGEFIQNPIKDFMIPFPYGEEKWKEDADFINQLIKEFEDERNKPFAKCSEN